MRAWVLCLVSIRCLGNSLMAQQTGASDTTASPHWTFAIGVFRSFAPAGQVSVRENVYTGTPLDFQRDLGMRPWSSLQLEARYRLKPTAALSLAAEHFLFSGSATSNRDIWYNGVHMTGTDGLSPAGTVLYRIQLAFEKKIHTERKVHPVLCAGLVADFLDFHVEGTVLPDTWGREQHERFARQALPYPFLGAKLIGRLGTHDQLVAGLSGTSIPEFKSFFDEGGPMRLQYATLQAGLDYGHRWGAHHPAARCALPHRADPSGKPRGRERRAAASTGCAAAPRSDLLSWSRSALHRPAIGC